MKYYVIEMQDGAVLSQSFNRAEFESGAAVSDYLSRGASAAISQVNRHTVMLVDDKGNYVDGYPPLTFEHEANQST